MAKKTAADVANLIMNVEFGDMSDIEGLSDDENDLGIAKNVVVNSTGETSTPALHALGNDEVADELLEENTDEQPAAKKAKKQSKPAKVTWHRKKFSASVPDEELDDFPTRQPHSPYHYFKSFIDDDLIAEFCAKTNMYYMQTHGKSLNVTEQEIKALFGIHIEIGAVPYPQLRMYWSRDRRYPLIADAMSFNRFSSLRNNLHIVDNMQQNNRDADKFWKVRPMMDRYLQALLETQPDTEKRICIDEQMIPFKGKLVLKQYMKGKPNPWGIKIFFLCGESGMPYNFVAYQGKSTKFTDEYKDLGVSGAVVMTLIEDRLKHENYRLFFDNYFTSPGLVKVLQEKGVYCTGTLRSNRAGHLPIKPNSELSKMGRGSMDGCTSGDGSMCIVKWNDNSLVTVLSSAYDWKRNISQVTRYDRSEKKYVQIPCPSSILEYNKSMGGVDKLDFLLSLYRIHIKSKKWTLRVIFHFIDLAVVTCWLQYMSDCNSISIPMRERFSLLDFRLHISESMIKHGTNPLSKKKGRKSAQYAPVGDVRYDAEGHFPIWKEDRERCKKEDCKDHFSHVFCAKCKVFLCFNKNRNCFTSFHTISV